MKRTQLLLRQNGRRFLRGIKRGQPFSCLPKGKGDTAIFHFTTTEVRHFTASADVTTRTDGGASSANFSFEQAISELPKGAQIHLDFFGEPVTFFGVSGEDKIQNAVASLDRFVIGIASKGKAFTGTFM
jgi:hypothetical protein